MTLPPIERFHRCLHVPFLPALLTLLPLRSMLVTHIPCITQFISLAYSLPDKLKLLFNYDGSKICVQLLLTVLFLQRNPSFHVLFQWIIVKFLFLLFKQHLLYTYLDVMFYELKMLSVFTKRGQNRYGT